MPVTTTTNTTPAAQPAKHSHTSGSSKTRTGSSTGSGSNEGRVDSVFGPSTESPSADDSWAVTRLTSRRSLTRPTLTEALAPLSVPVKATAGGPQRATPTLLPFTPRRFVADPTCSTSSSERLSVPASDQGTIEEPGTACKHPRMTSTTARPQPGSNLFVAGLPSTVDDDALVRLFSAFGRLITAKVVLNVNNAASRGFGFAQFATVAEADAARHALNGTAVPGHGGRLQIEPSRRSAVDVASSSASRIVTVRNVPVSTVVSPNEFLRLLETYGDVAAFDARPHPRGAETTTVTVRFRKSDDAAACAHAVHGSSPMKACATPLLARLGAPHERHNDGPAPSPQQKPAQATAAGKRASHKDAKDAKATNVAPASSKPASPAPAPLPLPQLPAAASAGTPPPWYAAYAAQQQQQQQQQQPSPMFYQPQQQHQQHQPMQAFLPAAHHHQHQQQPMMLIPVQTAQGIVYLPQSALQQQPQQQPSTAPTLALQPQQFQQPQQHYQPATAPPTLPLQPPQQQQQFQQLPQHGLRLPMPPQQPQSPVQYQRARTPTPPPAPGDTEPGPRQLIVNYLPPDMADAELLQLFSQIGPVEAARVIYDKTTGMTKGFGFVYFVRHAHARQAVASLSGMHIRGKHLKVGYANPQRAIASTPTGSAANATPTTAPQTPAAGIGAGAAAPAHLQPKVVALPPQPYSPEVLLPVAATTADVAMLPPQTEPQPQPRPASTGSSPHEANDLPAAAQAPASLGLPPRRPSAVVPAGVPLPPCFQPSNSTSRRGTATAFEGLRSPPFIPSPAHRRASEAGDEWSLGGAHNDRRASEATDFFRRQSVMSASLNDVDPEELLREVRRASEAGAAP